jgi:hypothetical protein
MPKWAPHNQSWGPIKPGFWDLWHAQRLNFQRAGYEVRKSETGEWQVRFVPVNNPPWPPVNPTTVFVKKGFKASICLECGKVDLISADSEHKACTFCGAKADPA